ncbi:MAG: hypothetical protein ACREDM_03245 [Methylocella sp.]
MNVTFSKPTKLAEFLERESRQEFRYEFDGFQPVAMTGGTPAPAAIQRNPAVSLTGGVRGKHCNFLAP